MSSVNSIFIIVVESLLTCSKAVETIDKEGLCVVCVTFHVKFHTLFISDMYCAQCYKLCI